MASEAPFRIIRFFTDYVKANGTLKEVDKVEYCGIGKAGTSTTVARIGDLKRVVPDADPDNVAHMMALGRWNFIRPQYEAWKAGNELPVDGTPLAAWPGLTKAQADIIRASGLRTVEEIAESPHSLISKVQLPGMTEIQRQAKLFVENAPKAKIDERLAASEADNAELRAQLEELRQIVVARDAEPDEDKPARKPRRAAQPETVAA